MCETSSITNGGTAIFFGALDVLMVPVLSNTILILARRWDYHKLSIAFSASRPSRESEAASGHKMSLPVESEQHLKLQAFITTRLPFDRTRLGHCHLDSSTHTPKQTRELYNHAAVCTDRMSDSSIIHHWPGKRKINQLIIRKGTQRK